MTWNKRNLSHRSTLRYNDISWQGYIRSELFGFFLRYINKIATDEPALPIHIRSADNRNASGHIIC